MDACRLLAPGVSLCWFLLLSARTIFTNIINNRKGYTILKTKFMTYILLKDMYWKCSMLRSVCLLRLNNACPRGDGVAARSAFLRPELHTQRGKNVTEGQEEVAELTQENTILSG